MQKVLLIHNELLEGPTTPRGMVSLRQLAAPWTLIQPGLQQFWLKRRILLKLHTLFRLLLQ